MNQHYLLPSNKPGHHWSLTVFRSGSRIIASAQEGRAGVVAGLGCTTFEFVMFGDRRESIPLVGVKRLTAKAEAAGITAMSAHLEAKGMLAGQAAPEPEPAKAQAQVAQIVGLEGGPVEVAIDDLVAAAEIRGFAHAGPSPNKALREEIRGLPLFDGLVGPMWGGHDDQGRPRVRYETWATHERLSA